MKCFIAALLLFPVLSFAQNRSYTPPKPGYETGGKKAIYQGYIMSRQGAKAYTLNKDYVGFCFDYLTPLPVFKETDTLVMVAFNGHERLKDDEFFYVNKKSIGKETDIPLDNYDLNTSYPYNEYWVDDKMAFEEGCGENQASNALNNSTEDDFDEAQYPDVLVTLLTEKEFLKAKSSAVPDYLTIDKSVKKVGKAITIGGQKFTDNLGEGNQPNIYTYIGDYNALNGSLLQYMCSACEEYSYPLIDKRNGKEIGAFTNIPVFSKNYEYVMDLGQLFSDSPTILSCYKWKDINKAEVPATYKEFGNWSPVGQGFWGADNCYYTPVVPSVVVDNHRADEIKRTAARYNFRYVKITIKGPTPKQE